MDVLSHLNVVACMWRATVLFCLFIEQIRKFHIIYTQWIWRWPLALQVIASHVSNDGKCARGIQKRRGR